MKIEFKKPDGTYFKKGQEITFEDIKSLPAEYFFDLRLGALLYDAKQEYLVHTGQIKSSTKEAEKEKKLKEKKLK